MYVEHKIFICPDCLENKEGYYPPYSELICPKCKNAREQKKIREELDNALKDVRNLPIEDRIKRLEEELYLLNKRLNSSISRYDMLHTPIG